MKKKMTSKEKPSFIEMNNLVCENVGGKIIFSTDDWFAVAENLLKPEAPVWKEGVFTKFGKWMDGWETRRKRIPGHDWCIIQLGIPGAIHGFDIDTSYFTGNYAPRVSIQAACLEKELPSRNIEPGTAATEKDFSSISALKSELWCEILPMTELKPGFLTSCHNYHAVNSKKRWTHLRFKIYPDGGVARLRTYGEAKPDWSKVPVNEVIDLAAMTNGGLCIGFSNAHYGHARNVIGIGRASSMADGWETARRLDRPPILTSDAEGILQIPGHEWAVFRLGHPGVISKIEIDTNHFKGNFPDSCKIEGCYIPLPEEGKLLSSDDVKWNLILPPKKLSAHQQHYYDNADVIKTKSVSHIRLSMAPDGGISRMRLYGLRLLPIEAKL